MSLLDDKPSSNQVELSYEAYLNQRNSLTIHK